MEYVSLCMWTNPVFGTISLPSTSPLAQNNKNKGPNFSIQILNLLVVEFELFGCREPLMNFVKMFGGLWSCSLERVWARNESILCQFKMVANGLSTPSLMLGVLAQASVSSTEFGAGQLMLRFPRSNKFDFCTETAWRCTQCRAWCGQAITLTLIRAPSGTSKHYKIYTRFLPGLF